MSADERLPVIFLTGRLVTAYPFNPAGLAGAVDGGLIEFAVAPVTFKGELFFGGIFGGDLLHLLVIEQVDGAVIAFVALERPLVDDPA